MDGQTYQIKLNINVDDSQLSKAERRIRDLERGPGRGRQRGDGRGSGGGNDSNIPPSRRPYYRALERLFDRKPGLSGEGFLSNVNRLYHKADVFKRAFLGNLTSLSGALRNLSNFGAVLGSIGRIAAGVIKPLGTVAPALTLVGGAIVAAKGLNILLRGSALAFGNRLLNNQNLVEAGSSAMQFEMARKGLGAAYEKSFQEAGRLAAEYGFSRTGLLNSINMFTGLNVGNRTLSREEATRIAMQAGKIAHVGGVPFERVNINLQQLLGQPTPSARDLRELIQAAPIIGKIAQQSMARKNVSGDVFSYLKDKSELLNVLNEFDRMIESNPFMKARGMAQLYKENAFIKIVQDNAEFWPKISQSLGIFYDKLAIVANQYIPKLADFISPEKIGTMMADVESAISDLTKIFGGIMSFLGWVGRSVPFGHADKFNVEEKWVPGAGGTVRKAFSFGGRFYYDDQGNKYPAINSDSLYSARQRAAFRDLVTRDSSYIISSLAAQRAGSADMIGGVPYPKAGFTPSASQRAAAIREFRANSKNFLQNPGRVLKPVPTIDGGTYWDIDYGKLFGQLNPAAGFDGNGGNISTYDGLSDITKGARSLIINFNREIVSMPISIDNVNDGADLGAQLQGALYDNIMRGLQVALNNATGAM